MRAITSTLAGLTAAAVTLLPTAASAGQWSHRDATGDVVKRVINSDTATPEVIPENTSVDVRRVRVTHDHSKLRVAMRIADLVGVQKYIQLRIRTSEGRQYGASWSKGPGVSRFSVDRGGRFSTQINCNGITASSDRSTDMIHLAFPRRCFGSPRWVRVGAQFYTFNESAPLEVLRVDDAIGSDLVPTQWFELRLSPRIRRGC